MASAGLVIYLVDTASPEFLIRPGSRRATFPPGEGIAPLQIRKKEIPP